MTEQNCLRDADVANETSWLVRKTEDGKWKCDVGNFSSFDEAVAYIRDHCGKESTRTVDKYFPIKQVVQTVTFIYHLPPV